jgi:hypothetical protein
VCVCLLSPAPTSHKHADIYNDFYSYACINLIEGELKAFAALAKAHGAGARASVEALEALTLWMAFEQAYSMVDDGECFEALVRCFGAAWHSVALALQTDGTLSADCMRIFFFLQKRGS